MAGRGDGALRAARRALTGSDRGAAPRASIHLATVGMLLVLLALTAFSIAAAVTNARVAARAQDSAAVSEWSETALDQLGLEENLADELKSPGPEADGEAPGQYAVARAAVTAALHGLAASVPPDRRGKVAEWIDLHDRYGKRLAVLLAQGPLDPIVAEEYEEEHLDPLFDPLEQGLEDEAQRHWDEADDALAAVGRIQEGLLVATPLVFGLGLGLVILFSVVQGRGRRLALAQAEENRHQSRHDSLTGLPNRELLREHVEAALTAARGGGDALTLMLIDLDRFKEINDTLGHRYGDLVLRVVAARLREALPASATVARLGGDEFGILLPDVGDGGSALEVATAILGEMDATIDAEEISLDVDASIGVVVSGEHGADVDTLLQHADIAMYRAKERSVGVCLYDHHLNHHSREELGLLGELRRAIDAGELVLEFQPKVSLPDAGFCGAEALVRWQHPERGMLPPGLFIPVAERTALIHPLTRYVLAAALEESRRWQERGIPLHVAVNVSVRNLLDDTFLGDVEELLARSQVPASCLELEVTESAIMADPERAQSVLAGFRALGVTVSIDDFGAGYTSLAQLSRLPVDQLKIDRSLVSRMADEGGDALIVRSVIELGHSLGLRTVAEGVEDAATSRVLGDLGCDVAQGYYFSRPIPADRLVEWHAAHSGVQAARVRTAGPVDLPTQGRGGLVAMSRSSADA
jgi:diguanylate cyclase (GGDEF)-like protein